MVKKNTFTSYQVTAENGNLLGAEIKIDPNSLDTSADLNNGMGGEWPEQFVMIRNINTVAGRTSEENGILTAKGSLDILDFNASQA